LRSTRFPYTTLFRSDWPPAHPSVPAELLLHSRSDLRARRAPGHLRVHGRHDLAHLFHPRVRTELRGDLAHRVGHDAVELRGGHRDRKSTRLNSSHVS